MQTEIHEGDNRLGHDGRTLIFDFYDGALEGFFQFHSTDPGYYFLAATEPHLAVRAWIAFRLSDPGMNEVVAAVSVNSTPSWPVWMPADSSDEMPADVIDRESLAKTATAWHITSNSPWSMGVFHAQKIDLTNSAYRVWDHQSGELIDPFRRKSERLVNCEPRSSAMESHTGLPTLETSK